MDVAESVETALAHACTNVPITEPDRRGGDVRQLLAGRRYDSASHIAVRDGYRFAGIVRVEDLFAASDDSKVTDIMDADPVGPGAIRRSPPGRRFARANRPWPLLTRRGGFSGVIPPDRLLAVMLAEAVSARWNDPAVAIGVAMTLVTACTTATLTAMALPALFTLSGAILLSRAARWQR